MKQAIALALSILAVNAEAASPQGYVDGVQGCQISGWAYDPDVKFQSIQVRYYDVQGLCVRGAVTANQYRPDLKVLGIGSYHGYVINIPPACSARRIAVYGVNVGPGLNNFLTGSPAYVNC